jgi:hypothetical protein
MSGMFRIPFFLTCLKLSFSKYLCRAESQSVKFFEKLLKEGRVVGSIEGIICFAGVPRTAQMIGGKHTDTGLQEISSW